MTDWQETEKGQQNAEMALQDAKQGQQNAEMTVQDAESANQTIQAETKMARKQFSKIGLMAFLGSLIIMALQIGVAGVVRMVKPELLGNNDVIFVLNMLPMYLIGMPILMLLLHTIPAQTIEKKKMKVGHWILSFFMCYALMYVSNLIGQMITMVIGFVKGGVVEDAMANLATSLNPALCFVFMVLIAPVLEEIIFRKLLIERMVKYGEATAILLSAFMFGMYHGNVNQLVYAFVLGLFFGFIYVKTGKLIYTIVLHMVINFLGSVVAIFILRLLDMEELTRLMTITDPQEMMEGLMAVLPGFMALMAYFVFIMGTVIAGIVLLIVMRKKFVVCKGQVQLPEGKRFSTIFINVGMILFVILWSVMIVMQLLQ